MCVQGGGGPSATLNCCTRPDHPSLPLPLPYSPTTCERSLLPRADGSARWTAGGTVALAAVYGPASTSARVEDPEAAVVRAMWRPAPDSTTSLPPSQSPAARALEAALAGAVRAAMVAEAAPRTAVIVDVTIEADDGGAAAAGVNAAAAALADAGGCVPLKALPAAATVALAPDGIFLVDPTASEAAGAAGVATFTFLTRGEPGGGDGDGGRGRVLSLVGGGGLAGARINGRFSDDQVRDALAVACGAALAAAKFNRAGLTKAFGQAEEDEGGG